jgi:membrane protease YdiL (CAAX protease family)
MQPADPVADAGSSRWRALAEIALVIALGFIKIFPFSSHLFATLGVVVCLWLRRDAAHRRWFARGKLVETLVWGVGGGICVIAADAGLQALYPLLGLAEPDYGRFSDLPGHPLLLVGWIAAIWGFVALTEEVISRGFLIDRWIVLLPAHPTAPALAVVASSVSFGLMHFYEGTAGVLSNIEAGLLFGALYILRKRTLWSNAIAHGVADTVALVAFYFRLV